MTSNNTLRSPEPPAGTEASPWQPDGGYRLLYTAARAVPGRPDTTVLGTAVQLSDGSIDQGTVEQPGVHVEVGTQPLTVAQARALAAAILSAADELAALAPNPADPLDGISTARILEEITRRASSGDSR